MAMALTSKQKRFVEEYSIDQNALQAKAELAAIEGPAELGAQDRLTEH